MVAGRILNSFTQKDATLLSPEIHTNRIMLRSLPFAALLFLCQINFAHSGVIIGTATPFTGDPAKVTVTLDDMGGSGKIKISVNVDTSVSIGDLRGVFFHISNQQLLTPGGFSILNQLPTGAVTTSVFGPANGVSSAGSNSNNLNGGGTPGPFDMGFEIGSQGIGTDDYQFASFELKHSSVSLDLSLFANQNFGVRVMSVGTGRNGSSKLGGTFGPVPPTPGPTPVPGTVPEPATLAIWSVLGLCGLGAARRKRGKQA